MARLQITIISKPAAALHYPILLVGRLKWGRAHYIIESKVQWKQAILACHPAVSTEWLAWWQFPIYYDVCARPPLPSKCSSARHNSDADARECFLFVKLQENSALESLAGLPEWQKHWFFTNFERAALAAEPDAQGEALFKRQVAGLQGS